MPSCGGGRTVEHVVFLTDAGHGVCAGRSTSLCANWPHPALDASHEGVVYPQPTVIEMGSFNPTENASTKHT
ncbi:hypothetical protein HPB50_007253 [Hyalomma asiaticum]|uniref:Uncharacterized protein n=1 Tax=Hyalomma asiaticum TaxID=266040 RepID=A0ACB7TG68_HYAAI|nr:hypothetical protein HPB50_007253 [Hyalomma asiaticum]